MVIRPLLRVIRPTEPVAGAAAGAAAVGFPLAAAVAAVEVAVMVTLAITLCLLFHNGQYPSKLKIHSMVIPLDKAEAKSYIVPIPAEGFPIV